MCETQKNTVLFYYILGCVLPMLEVALRRVLQLVAPQCYLSNDILVFQLILHPLSPLCASNGPFIVFHMGDVSSPFPFPIGYVLDYVCHSGSLPNDDVTDSVL